jgi:L-asparaginase
VVILTTGGTIAMAHDETAGGAIPTLGGEELIANLPADLPELAVEELVQLPSSHFRLDTLWIIRERVAELMEDPSVEGVVITHGTDTLEETAYLLDLSVPAEKPIVLTGAMRTASQEGYDGNVNLLDAIRVASTPEANQAGVVVVFNGEIHAARHATKVHTLSPAAFQSPGSGPIGAVNGTGVMLNCQMKQDILPWLGLEPNVTLIKLVVGMEPNIFEHVLMTGTRGIVLEALGGGRVPPWWLPVIEQTRTQDVPVVIASRCAAGPVWDTYGYPGAYQTLADLGCIFSRGLSGPKARIKLMLILASAQRLDQIVELWEQ